MILVVFSKKITSCDRETLDPLYCKAQLSQRKMNDENKQRTNSLPLSLIHFYAAQECYTGNWNAYRGNISITERGKLCQNWNSQKPHTHEWTPEKYAPCNI